MPLANYRWGHFFLMRFTLFDKTDFASGGVFSGTKETQCPAFKNFP